MRERFASKLVWLEKKHKEPGLADLRKDARIIPTTLHSILTLADGTTQACLVIDMSPSGAAVSARLQPQIGMPLAVGTCIGRVVRLLPDGFAVKFVEPLNRLELERRLVTRFTRQVLPSHAGRSPEAAAASCRSMSPSWFRAFTPFRLSGHGVGSDRPLILSMSLVTL
jgi:hypothetical protein